MKGGRYKRLEDGTLVPITEPEPKTPVPDDPPADDDATDED